MTTMPSPSYPPGNLELPTYSFEDGAILCQEPHLTSVRVNELTKDEFLAAYPWAWDSLAHFDPAALSAATAGAISPARAVQAKAMFAAELVAHSVEPRQGRLVSVDKLYLRILNPAFSFLEDELSSQDHAGVTHGLALILAIDDATAGRLAEGRREMAER